MNLDMTELLRDWPHEPGTLQARIIEAGDGSRKLQVRLDLGIIQMEMDGRPDGQSPEGYASLLDLHKARAAEDPGEYSLDEEECAALQAEGIQYYHRYVSLLHLEEYEPVIRDTRRNLDLFDFVEEHADDPGHAEALTQFRPYVLMVHVRARAALAADRDSMAAAMAILSDGRRELLRLHGHDETAEEYEGIPELSALDEWAADFLMDRPLSRRDRMLREMDEAIEAEAYERAAELRDELRALGKGNS